jgi:class 3 adenylate cyclase
MIEEDQMPERYRNLIADQVAIYSQGRSMTVCDSIPDTDDIPIVDPKLWLRIPNVICVYVDMKSSTKLSAEVKDKSTAGAYQLFTGTAVRLFNEFEAPYIDVRGDGVFALFNADEPYRALAAAVTFKTFAQHECIPKLKEDTEVDVGCHIGIDQSTVLVRKLGIKRSEGRSDRQNEVWAGKTVNMASKLSSLGEDNQLLASDRFYSKVTDDIARLSCGCGSPDGKKTSLWEAVDVSARGLFDFDTAYLLKSQWCKTHGREYCEQMLELDKNG